MQNLNLVLASALLAVSLQGCCKGSSSDSSCPSKYSELPASQQSGVATCSCAAGATTGTAWGTDIYTTDSSICAAAVHAGVITSAGGEVKVTKAPACQAYSGSVRNGITTSDWGSWGGSFYFAGKGDGKCAAAAPAAKPAGGAECPRAFNQIPGLNAATELTCDCSAGSATGTVWGTDTYTQDSSICAAAVHVGEVTASGGKVKVKAAAGCKKYKGSTRNGISSSDWGPYDNSYYFPNKTSGSCQ